MHRMLLLLISLTVLSGCANLVLPTLVALHRLDPLTADPAGFAVELTIDPEFRVEPNSARLSITATNGITGEVLGGPQPLTITREQGAVSTYRLTPQAAEAVRNLQTAANDWPKTGSHALAISFGLDGCLVSRDADPRFSVALQLGENTPKRTLLRNARVGTALRTIGKDATSSCSDL